MIQTLLRGFTDRHEEAQILALLADAEPDVLDEVLRSLDGEQLFASLDDRLIGPDHRTALRSLLVGRLGELSLEAQATLVHGLQARHSDRADEEAILAVFLSHRGEELTRLKNLLNARTDEHDLEGLVFNDVDHADIRADILAHIAREASGVTTGDTKILCDIDDTVVCALHDRRYPRGAVYPGVLALLDALDRGPRDEPFSLGDLTFVTARPGDAFGLIENHTRTTLRRAGVTTSSVLTGTLFALATHDLMAGQKLANIQHYRQLFPEYRTIFIGDSGQGDIRVGRLLHEHIGADLDAVVIHDVVGTPPEQRAALDAEGIHLVDTYVGAARHVHAKGLISDAGLSKVIDESRAALDAIRWRSAAQRDAVASLIERDASA